MIVEALVGYRTKCASPSLWYYGQFLGEECKPKFYVWNPLRKVIAMMNLLPNIVDGFIVNPHVCCGTCSREPVY